MVSAESNMIFLLIVCVLVVVVYGAYRIEIVNKGVAAMSGSLERDLKEIHSLVRGAEPIHFFNYGGDYWALRGGLVRQKPSGEIRNLAYEWFDEGWPVARVDEEDRAPIENPVPHRNPDEYTVQMYIAEYRALPNPRERKDFLRTLVMSHFWFWSAEFLDLVYTDESPHVRAWAAAHLPTVLTNSTSLRAGLFPQAWNSIEIRNYEPAILADTAPIVRAALWSNPRCRRLPWMREIILSENWKEQFRSLSHLERLGIMRNPDISRRYVLALMGTPPEELAVSRVEHAEVLRAAAMNPTLVGESRRDGRKAQRGYTDVDKEYGKMWELSLTKWMDDEVGRSVPYAFLRFIQTTPETKRRFYKVLLAEGEKERGLPPSQQEISGLRQVLIESCDPLEDREVLRLAWTDPYEGCSDAAKVRVGRFTELVGVQDDAKNTG